VVADASAEKLARLEAAVRADPGDVAFPALAELYRRAGRLKEAEGVVREGLERAPKVREGHVVLGLTLLNQGRYDDALAAFESVAADVVASAGGDAVAPVDSGPSDVELDQAFEQAAPDEELLVTPDRVAEEAVERVDAAAEQLAEKATADEIGTGGTFVTRTMADVLERQGDWTGAAQIRAALAESGATADPAAAVEDPEEAWRLQTIAVLESWLQNLRGEAR
jgi:tetratricopeptide (TPR) repeat protein